jgi:hypothetical protein
MFEKNIQNGYHLDYGELPNHDCGEKTILQQIYGDRNDYQGNSVANVRPRPLSDYKRVYGNCCDNKDCSEIDENEEYGVSDYFNAGGDEKYNYNSGATYYSNNFNYKELFHTKNGLLHGGYLSLTLTKVPLVGENDHLGSRGNLDPIGIAFSTLDVCGGWGDPSHMWRPHIWICFEDGKVRSYKGIRMFHNYPTEKRNPVTHGFYSSDRGLMEHHHYNDDGEIEKIDFYDYKKHNSRPQPVPRIKRTEIYNNGELIEEKNINLGNTRLIYDFTNDD